MILVADEAAIVSLVVNLVVVVTAMSKLMRKK